MQHCSSRCTACDLAPPGAPVFYQQHVVDGAGGTIMAMLYGAAYAASLGMRYGGVVAGCPAGGLCHSHVVHGLSVDSAIELILGTHGYSILRFNISFHKPGQNISAAFQEHISSTAVGLSASSKREVFSTMDALAAVSHRLAAHQPQEQRAFLYRSTYLPLDHLGGSTRLETFLSSSFLGRLRSASACRLRQRVSHFSPGRPSVAIHVRRGDVVPVGLTAKRWTATNYYLMLAQASAQHPAPSRPPQGGNRIRPS